MEDINNTKELIVKNNSNNIEINNSYKEFLTKIIKEIRTQQITTRFHANTEMICMYWKIGKSILNKQEKEGWGSKIIDRLAQDIKKALPDINGFSPRNIKNMRRFAIEWKNFEFVQRTVAQIPWRTNILLMEKLTSIEERIWYAEQTIKNGWSRDILAMQIDSKLIERSGKSINNFELTLPNEDSDMVKQIFKDPYLFDFLGTDIPHREIEIEKKLTEHIQNFLLELGQGFAFVGRQVHLEIGEQDFYIDLLFYHLKLRCYIVIELKTGEFEPSFISQLNMYQNVVDDILKHPDDKPTIGLLLVRNKNKTIVEYSIKGYMNPIGIADWKNKLTDSITKELKENLPSIEKIEKEFE